MERAFSREEILSIRLRIWREYVQRRWAVSDVELAYSFGAVSNFIRIQYRIIHLWLDTSFGWTEFQPILGFSPVATLGKYDLGTEIVESQKRQ